MEEVGRRETGGERSEGSDIKMKGGKRIGERKKTSGRGGVYEQGPNPQSTPYPNKHKYCHKILTATSNIRQCHFQEGPSQPGYTAASSSLRSEGQETSIIRYSEILV